VVLSGTREGLFLAAIAAKRWVEPRKNPAILIPNPFYAAYAAGALAADCEPVFLAATAQTGFLPDLAALTEPLLARTVEVRAQNRLGLVGARIGRHEPHHDRDEVRAGRHPPFNDSAG